MSKGVHDIFALDINFLGTTWQPKHVSFGFCEETNISSQILAIKLIDMLEKDNLKKNIVAYVKGEGSNLNT
jgi:hypothetical protein